ncbi:hypothetical protein Bca4012_083217 [Brassica carinata]|uniref:Uncharacterized protein n=1 Tax=Brassica carinata TaxID=52824 RepID=A0A8X7VAP1_BRACI|nr:hypothetical protein Bca52824_027549 [Brassica carinata]
MGAPATNAGMNDCGVMEGASDAADVLHDESDHGGITADGPPLQRLSQQSLSSSIRCRQLQRPPLLLLRILSSFEFK